MASSSGGNRLGEGESEHDFISSLDELCKEYDRETARQAIQTMLTLANNVIKSPEDEKYRKVKTQNKSFSSKVWSLPEAQEFLLLWGWVEVDDCVVLSSDEDIQLVKQILQKKLNAISSSTSQRSQAEAGPSNTEPLTEKEKQLKEERRKFMEKKKLEEEEKARIKAQIQADRRDTKGKESRESRARKLDKFGGKMTKFEDIGIDLNKGGG